MAYDLHMSAELEQVDGELRDHFRALAFEDHFLKVEDRISRTSSSHYRYQRSLQKYILVSVQTLKSNQLLKIPPRFRAPFGKPFDLSTFDHPPGWIKVKLFELVSDFRRSQAMSNQELMSAGMKTMDETDQAIARSEKVVQQTIEVGAQTAVTMKGQSEQMGRIVNELDTIQFSFKKASQLVKEIGRLLTHTTKILETYLVWLHQLRRGDCYQ